MAENRSRKRGIVLSAVAALVIAAIYVLLRQRHSPELLVQSDEGWQPDVRVAVGGEVINPGTYTLHGDARISDLVAAAGGFTEQAGRAALNPAARLSDGMEYIIPVQSTRASGTQTRPPTATSASSSATPVATATTAPTEPRTTVRAATATSAAAKTININTATRDELEVLPFIGPAIAQRIVDDRTANDPYKQIEDLARVRGISPRTVDQLRDRITVGP